MANNNCQTLCPFFSNSSADVAWTFWTCSERLDYCSKYRVWLRLNVVVQSIMRGHLLVLGFIGLCSYALMFFVHRMKFHNSVTFIYYRCIDVLEILHMLVMFQDGLISLLEIQKSSFSYAIYRYQTIKLWVFGDAVKLTVALITAILSLECALAIWHPPLFKRINRSSVAKVLTVVAVLIGCLHLTPIICTKVAARRRLTSNSMTYFKYQTYTDRLIDRIVWRIIYAIKLLTSAVMAILCTFIVTGLVQKSRKASSMANTAKEKWNDTRRMCAMQMLLAVTCLLDHTVWVCNSYIYYEYDSTTGTDAVTALTFDSATRALSFRKVLTITGLIETLSGAWTHSCRFFLYLVFVKTFRTSFLVLLKSRTETARVTRLDTGRRA